MKVYWQVTPPTPRNPYYRALYDPLRRLGWEGRFEPDLSALAASVGQETPVHFHQLEPLYRSRGTLGVLVKTLYSLKVDAVPLVYTLHNEWPHEAVDHAEDYRAQRAVAEVADCIIVHGSGAIAIARRFGAPEKIRVVPHPSLIGVYGAIVGRHAARRRVGLPIEARVALALGEFRRYKRLERIIDSFRELRGLLVVAGRPSDGDYVSELREKSANLSNVRIVDKELTSREICTWLSAADVSVFAFDNILMSTALMLSLSYGIPCVAPAVGCIPDYVIDGMNGFLYSGIPELRRTLQESFDVRWSKDAVRESVGMAHPDRVGTVMAEIYDSIVK